MISVTAEIMDQASGHTSGELLISCMLGSMTVAVGPSQCLTPDSVQPNAATQEGMCI